MEEAIYGRVVSVSEEVESSALTEGVSAGATTLPVEIAEGVFDDPDPDESPILEIRLSNEDGSVVEVASYDDVDYEANTLLLTAPLANAFLEGDSVEVWSTETGLVQDGVAQVWVDDDPDQVVDVAVPSHIQPYLEVEQTVRLREVDEDDWVIEEIVGAAPVMDATVLDPETVPPPAFLGDGVAPPDPTEPPDILRAVRTNIVNMSAYDPPVDWKAMLPEYQISIDGGLNWTDAEEVADQWTSLGLTGIWLAHGVEPPTTQPGDEGHPDRVYRYRYRVLDIDNMVSNYSDPTEPVSGRRVNEDGAVDIEADTIIGLMFSSVVNHASLFTTRVDENSPGVESDPTGIRIYGTAGLLVGSFPTTGAIAFLKAILEAQGLDVLGNATFRGLAEFPAGSAIQLRKGISAPTTAPSLIPQWPQLTLAGGDYQYRHLFHDATAGRFLTIARVSQFTTSVMEFNATTGAFVRSVVHYSTDFSRVRGAVRAGSHIFVLVKPQFQGWQIRKLNQSDGSQVASQNIDSNVVGDFPCLGYNGTDLLVAMVSATGSGNELRVRKFSTTDLSLVSTTTGSGFAGYGEGTGFINIEERETRWWVTSSGSGFAQDKVRAFTLTGAYDSPKDFIRPGMKGLAHDGSVFRSLDDSGVVYQHTNWTTPTAPSVKYAWKDTVNNYVTLVGPAASLSDFKRAVLQVTVGTFPAGVNAAAVYVDNKKQGDQTTTNFYYSFDSGGEAPPGSNTFPEGGNAEIRDNAGVKIINADGIVARGFRVYRAAAASHTSSGNFQQVPFDTEAHDADGLFASNRFTVPAGMGGKWRLLARVTFVGNINGNFRQAKLVKNPAGTPVDLDRDIVQVSSAIALTLKVIYEGELLAGDVVEVQASQNSGGTLAYTVGTEQTWFTGHRIAA